MINMNTDWKKECKAETLKTETELMQHADDLKLRVVPGFIILPLISFLSLIDLISLCLWESWLSGWNHWLKNNRPLFNATPEMFLFPVTAELTNIEAHQWWPNLSALWLWLSLLGPWAGLSLPLRKDNQWQASSYWVFGYSWSLLFETHKTCLFLFLLLSFCFCSHSLSGWWGPKMNDQARFCYSSHFTHDKPQCLWMLHTIWNFYGTWQIHRKPAPFLFKSDLFVIWQPNHTSPASLCVRQWDNSS